jgi:dTDP-4-amino-4,6-dideoxygalactose transaminase
MPDPEAIVRRTDLRDVGAIMVVSPFGSPVNTRVWDDFTAQTGIPAIIDGAAAFDTVNSVPEAGPGKTPIMVSLHATKVLGVGEGGVVLSTDEATMRRFRQICNFGVWGSPEGQILGYNGKLSEYHAAVGLAALAGWQRRRRLIAALTDAYIERLNGISEISLLPRYGDGWVSCYCNVAVAHDAAPIVEQLFELGIGTRRWWQRGVHQQRAYKDFSRDELPVTESLGQRVFGLPFFHDMTPAQLDRVVNGLKAALMPLTQPLS